MALGGRKVWLGEGDTSLHNDSWFDAQVLDNNDPSGAMRIKVKAIGLDKDSTKTDELILTTNWDEIAVNPLLPKFLTMPPKVDERVKIWVPDSRMPNVNRYYIGPAISQLNDLDFQDYMSANAGTQSSPTKLNASYKDNPASEYHGNRDWSVFPNTSGVYPDIAINSRGNSDVILRSKSNYDEIQLRVAKYDYKKPDNKFNINLKNPAYIIIGHYQPPKPTKLTDSLGLDKDKTHINFVADNLNLISHIGSEKKGSISDVSDNILSGDPFKQLKVEQNKLHPLLYGDVFWDFLQLLGNYVGGHIHKGSRREPDNSLTTKALLDWIGNNSGSYLSKTSVDSEDIVVKTYVVDSVKTFDVIQGSTFLSKGVKTN